MSLFEPPDVNAAQCSNCEQYTLEYEVDSKGVVLCWDCLEKIMKQGDEDDKHGVE